MPRLPQQLSGLKKYRHFITCSRIPRDASSRGHSFDLRKQRSLSKARSHALRKRRDVGFVSSAADPAFLGVIKSGVRNGTLTSVAEELGTPLPDHSTEGV